jgi:F-type H+-transporting ATPase subunit delta
MASAIANRFAKALAELVARPNSGLTPEQAISQLAAFEALYRESPELKNVLLSPAVPGARKRAVVRRVADDRGIAPLILKFLFVIIDHRRLNYLSAIRQAFEAVLDEKLGLVRVDVASAREIAAPQRERMIGELSKLTGRQVRANFAVDGSLLGGAAVRIGSVTYDGSVRGQLETLLRRLKAE